MTRSAGDPPLRSSRPVATGYGPLTVTLFWGEEGQGLDLPGIPRIEASGTVLASPAVLAQLEDDWTGEIEGWLGDRSVRTLPDAALAYPRELVIVEFTDTVPPEAVSSSHFQPIRVKRSYAPDTSFVILGLLVLALPSIALARAGAAVHLNARSRRYGLLRVLGAPPRRLAALIALDIAAPVLAGALLGSVVYAATMSSLNTFTLAGSSYWARDLVLPIALALALPLVVVLVGLLSAVRMITRAGRDPVGTLRKERKPASYLTYLSSGWRRGRSRRHVLGFKRRFYAVGVADYGGNAPERRRPRGTISDRGRCRRQAARRLDAGTGGRITDVSWRIRSRAGRVRYGSGRPPDRVLRVREHR